GRTALHWAAEQGHLLVTQALLNTGANFEPRCLQNRTPLMLATLGGHEEVVCMMLKAGAGITKQRYGIGNSPLHRAAHFRHVNISKILLQYGAETDLRNHRGGSPLHIAACQGSVAITTALLDAGA
ncbi:unnamed protein product, partial [Ascophyllum nodosum]